MTRKPEKPASRVVAYNLPDEDVDLIVATAAARTIKTGKPTSASSVVRDLISRARNRLESEINE